MLHAMMEWGASFPPVRRPIIRLWRKLERLQRATVSKAVLVIRSQSGRVLVLSSSSEPLRLPATELSPWEPVATQIAASLPSLLDQGARPSLVAIDGTPSQGIIFLYAATAEIDPDASDALWLHADVALSSLAGEESRLLRLCLDRQESHDR
jgi:hypothetical protein